MEEEKGSQEILMLIFTNYLAINKSWYSMTRGETL